METTNYSVTASPGDPESEDLVIAFAGVMSALGGVDIREFSTTLGAQPLKRHVLFVREHRPQWYNSADAPLVEMLKAEGAGRRLFTLGNSMGGFAAILFSLLLPGPSRSISFCPQFSVHPDEAPFEPRWRDHADAIETWSFPTCLPDEWNVARGLTHYVFCGDQVGPDIRHVERIRTTANNDVMAFLIDGCGHEVARHLKLHGVLVPLLDALIAGPGDADSIGAVLEAGGVGFRRLG